MGEGGEFGIMGGRGDKMSIFITKRKVSRPASQLLLLSTEQILTLASTEV